MTKISALPSDSAPSTTDYIPMLDAETMTTKRTTLGLLQPFDNPYKFSVYRNASQSVTSGTATKINFDTELYDSNNDYNNSSTYRYTAPVNGFYHFDCGIEGTTSGGGFAILYLYKNGSNIRQLSKLYIGTATGGEASGGVDLQLAAGDYIEGFFYLTGTSVAVGQNTAWLTGHLISRT